MKKRLDTTKPTSKELLPIVDQVVSAAKDVNAIAKTPQSTDPTALDKYKPIVKKAVEDLQGIVTRCNLILQQTGNTATGPATPATPGDIQKNPSLTVSEVSSR